VSDREPVVPPSKESGSLVTPVASAIIWISYFFVVYLIAEARCSIALFEFALLGASAAFVLTVAFTLLAIGMIVGLAVRSWRRWRRRGDSTDLIEQGRMLGLLGVVSGGIFVLATLLVGVPVLFLPPC
jgi:hypothetical protein